MCGIAGKVSFTAKNVGEPEIRKMTDAIRHRGPDDWGYYISPGHKVGLGHRRLSIIDLSPLGHQPMEYKNRYIITFNGEIYSYLEEKQKLIRAGYRFRSKSDTEVILALYDKYGVRCVDHLRGMFSFAIFDRQKNTLFCARDRIGKKPFKYYYDKKVFIFASELKAILTQGECHREPDFTAIHHYLTLQYCPAPLTGFVGINKLEPAHYLFLDLTKNTLENVCYWHLDYSKKLDLSETDWKKRILAKLEQSTRLRMISDVPLGAFLSGGVDSSAVVAMMAKNSKHPIRTFSIGFKEEKYNELKYASLVARKFGTDHTEFMVEPENIGILPDLIKSYEEPYADSSQLPTYFLSQLTRKYVTVALNGDGGDENFAGYGRYSIQKFSLLYDRFSLLNQMAIPVTGWLGSHIQNTFLDRARRFALSAGEDYRKRYVNYICYFDNLSKADLYTPAFAKKMAGLDSYAVITRKFAEAKTGDRLDQTLYADFTTYLPDDLMVKVDIASMANSLEGRSPFLDHEFVEMAAAMPVSLKIRGFNDKKYILKAALRGLVPDEAMFRPKMGFGVPLEHWFRKDLSVYTRSLLLSKKSVTRGLFNPDYVTSMLKTHTETRINLSSRIWALMALELWFQAYFP